MKSELSSIINENNKKTKTSPEDLLKKCLLLEYKYVQKFCPLDVYIMPEFSDIKKWNGVLFIKEGAYKKGIFKFIIQIPQSYPSKAPTVIFQTKILHPLVDSKSGIVDIKDKFETWKPGKHLIINVIHYVKEIFCDPSYIQDYKKGSKGISALIQKEIEKYCDESFQKRYLGEEGNLPYHSLSFAEMNKSMKIFIEKIANLNKAQRNLTITEKVSEMNQWFTESYLNIVKDENDFEEEN